MALFTQVYTQHKSYLFSCDNLFYLSRGCNDASPQEVVHVSMGLSPGRILFASRGGAGTIRHMRLRCPYLRHQTLFDVRTIRSYNSCGFRTHTLNVVRQFNTTPLHSILLANLPVKFNSQQAQTYVCRRLEILFPHQERFICIG